MMRSLLLISVFFLSSCFNLGRQDKAPPVTVNIEIISEGSYRLDGEPCRYSFLKESLKKTADKNRRPITGNVRGYVYIVSAGSGVGDSIQRLTNYCISIGFDKIIRK